MFFNIRDAKRRAERAQATGYVIGLAAVCLVVSGCATPFRRMTGAKAGLCGEAVADAAIRVYDDLLAVAVDNAYYQGYLRIVVSPMPDTVDFTRISEPDMSSLVEQRVRVYRQFRTTYTLFHQLCSGESNRYTSQSYASLAETLKGLSNDEAASAETKKMVSELPGALTALWQAKHIDRMQTVLGHLAADLGALWEREIPIWEHYVDAVYIEHYASGLLSLRLANFDEKGLAKAVDDPYDFPVKAGLYKLQKYQEALQKANRIKKELHTVSKAFQQLAILHRQLSEPAVALSDILDTQNRIGHYAAFSEQAEKE